MGVCISSDSGSDLFPDLYRQHGIEIVPLYISLEGETRRDVYEIGPDDLFRSYERTHRLPKTSAPPPADFFELFREQVRRGNDVVHISMNSRFSSSFQNAQIAAAEFDNVYVVDSLTISSAQGMLALRAAELRDTGVPAPEIARQMEELKGKMRANVLLDTLEFAYRGGRASMLQMFGANLLRLRPCLYMEENGGLAVRRKFRGNFAQVCREYLRFILGQPDLDGKRAFLTTTGMEPALFEELRRTVSESGKFEEVLTARAGCAITVHSGPNALVLFYMAK